MAACMVHVVLDVVAEGPVPAAARASATRPCTEVKCHTALHQSQSRLEYPLDPFVPRVVPLEYREYRLSTVRVQAEYSRLHSKNLKRYANTQSRSIKTAACSSVSTAGSSPAIGLSGSVKVPCPQAIPPIGARPACA